MVVTIARGSLEILWTLSVNRGDLIILASQLLWVGYTLGSRANRSTLSPLQMLAGAHAVAAAVLLPSAMSDECRIYDWSENEPQIDGLKGKPFVEFKP